MFRRALSHAYSRRLPMLSLPLQNYATAGRTCTDHLKSLSSKNRRTFPEKFSTLANQHVVAFPTLPTVDHVRLALESDLKAISAVFAEQRNCASQLRTRCESYIASQIQEGNAIVLELDQKVVAYGEVAVMHDKDEIKTFFLDSFQWRGYRHQDGDVLIYNSGFVSSPDMIKGWTPLALKFVENHYFSSERGIRKAWQDPSSFEEDFPKRFLVACGVANGGCGLKILEHVFGQNFLGGNVGPTFTEKIQHEIADGSGRTGTLGVCYFDRPLTHHQHLRTSRNRYLITDKEQQRLLNTRIGIVGLSTGSVAMEALLREGIGGIFRLADFDVFETSNSNRMLYGSHQAGESKMSLCVERLSSVDPAIQIEEYPSGLTQDNVREFVEDCDIIIEECDDFRVKLLIRQAAQDAKVPLLMATSQNGMIDVERYDCDEHCQPFNLPKPIDMSGLMDATSKEAKREEMTKLATSLYDTRHLSARMMASVSEMGRSISSWPQLAEEVFLNSAALSHASRRILTGDKSIVSGRFSIKMDNLFTAYNRTSLQRPSVDPLQGLAPHPRPPFALEPSLDKQIKQLLFIVHWARTAPSGGNAQPWDTTLKVKSGQGEEPCVEICFRPGAEDSPMIQPWNELALGCLLENAEIAAAHLGVKLEMNIINLDPLGPIAGTIRLGDKNESDGEILKDKESLFHAMSVRSSVRTTKPWTEELPEKLVTRLEALGVQIVQDANRKELISKALVKERETMFVVPEQRKRLLSEVGPDVCKIHPALLGLSEDDKKSLKIMEESPETLDFMASQGQHKVLLEPLENELKGVTSFLVLCDDGSGQALGNVQRGRLLETVWLEAVHHGVGIKPSGLLMSSHLKSIEVPGAFFILIPVKPCSLGLCSSRLQST